MPTTWNPWAGEYARTPERYVFGTAPSEFALEVARLTGPGDHVLDHGGGEGRDSVFLAQIGCEVTGVEIVEYFCAGELHEAFRNWQTLKRGDHVINCAQDGTPHGHGVEELVTARPPALAPRPSETAVPSSSVSGRPFHDD